jgi:hypothetical protein
MSYCVCDYDSPKFYVKTSRKARKVHRCSECGCHIQPGEQYEHVSGMWDYVDTFKTCQRCISLRDWVAAHVPCFCWAHGNIREDAIETARHWAHEAPGMLFGTWRREVAIQRHRKATRPT